MENETPTEIAERHSKMTLNVRFNLFDAALDYFLTSYATRALFKACGVTPKKSPTLTEMEDFQELAKTYLEKLPNDLVKKIVEPNRPVYKFPNSDEWMHWLRNNVPAGMDLEDFEGCVYHSDLYVIKWKERFTQEYRQFGGIMMLSQIGIFLVRAFLVLSIYYMATHGKSFAATMCTLFTFASMFVCMKMTDEKS